MSEPALDYDPLLSSVYQVLAQMRPALEALEAISAALDGAEARKAGDLAALIARERIFGPRDLSAFDLVIRTVAAKVKEGLVRQVDYQEFADPDVYWDYSEDAARLNDSNQALVLLRDRLEQVHTLRRAEQLTATFRTEDA